MPFNLVSTKFHETNFMTLKQKLEDHVIIIFLTVVVLAFSAGWTASEQARVANKTEKIAELEKRIADQSQQLKDNNAAIEPCQKEINELRSKAKSQEAVIKASQDNLTQSRQAIQSLNDLNHKLNLDLQACASNSNVMSLLREVEKKKESVEQSIATAYQWDSEKPKLEDYKRQAAEYQLRIESLQQKLSCGSK